MRKDLVYRLPEVGRIKIGRVKAQRVTSSSGKQFAPPEKLDHFIITTMERDKTTGQLKLDPIMQKLPKDKDGKVRELDVVLLHNDPEANFFSCYSYYHGRGKVFCRGNGNVAMRTHIDEKATNTRCSCRQDAQAAKHHKDGATEAIYEGGCGRASDCPFIRRNGKAQSRCKPEGVLRCILPTQRLVGGSYVFRSHAWNTVDDLEAALLHYASITGGYLAGLPFKLVIAPKSSQVEGVGSVTVYTVKLLYEPESGKSGYQELRQLAQEQAGQQAHHAAELKRLERVAAAQLEAAITDATEDDNAEVEAEFQPANTDNGSREADNTPAEFDNTDARAATSPDNETEQSDNGAEPEGLCADDNPPPVAAKPKQQRRQLF